MPWKAEMNQAMLPVRREDCSTHDLLLCDPSRLLPPLLPLPLQFFNGRLAGGLHLGGSTLLPLQVLVLASLRLETSQNRGEDD